MNFEMWGERRGKNKARLRFQAKFSEIEQIIEKNICNSKNIFNDTSLPFSLTLLYNIFASCLAYIFAITRRIFSEHVWFSRKKTNERNNFQSWYKCICICCDNTNVKNGTWHSMINKWPWIFILSSFSTLIKFWFTSKFWLSFEITGIKQAEVKTFAEPQCKEPLKIFPSGSQGSRKYHLQRGLSIKIKTMKIQCSWFGG